ERALRVAQAGGAERVLLVDGEARVPVLAEAMRDQRVEDVARRRARVVIEIVVARGEQVRGRQVQRGGRRWLPGEPSLEAALARVVAVHGVAWEGRRGLRGTHADQADQ